MATEIYKVLSTSDLHCEGANFFLSDGKQAGQEVPHCHIHVTPRFSGDGIKVGFSKERHLRPSRAELNAIAQKISAKF